MSNKYMVRFIDRTGSVIDSIRVSDTEIDRVQDKFSCNALDAILHIGRYYPNTTKLRVTIEGAED